MKKVFVIMLLSVAAYTAQSQILVGGGLGYGTGAEELGLNLRAGYLFTENIGAAADFMLYFTPDNVSYSEINLNGNYFFSTEEFRPYALLGLNYSTVSVTLPFFGTVKNSEIGLNIGAGAQYWLKENIALFGEARYVLGNADQLVIAVGVGYAFN